MNLIRWLFAYLAWSIETAGYWIRPYDMLADRRRWRWRPRQRCGWSYGLRADAHYFDEIHSLPEETINAMTTGWNEHGHARRAGLHIDYLRAIDDLQDAENCGYSPISTLAGIGVDQTRRRALDQFRAGRIVLLDGTVLERGGTLNSVWAVTQLPASEG